MDGESTEGDGAAVSFLSPLRVSEGTAGFLSLAGGLLWPLTATLAEADQLGWSEGRAVARAGVGEVLRRVLGVKGMVVLGAHMEPHGVVVQVRPRQRRARCSECGQPGPGYDTRQERLWRHLSLGRTVFWLRYAPRRVECREHGARVEQVPWAAHDSAFTFEFEEMTAWLAQRMDKTATSRLMGINWRTVGTLIQRVVKARLDKERLED